MIKGIMPAMLTAMDQDGAINYKSSAAFARRLINLGVHGLFVLGTNGEFYAMSTDEKEKLTSAIKNEVGDEAPLIAGSGMLTTAETIDLSRKLARQGADYLSVITPFFNKLSQKEQVEHFQRVAEASPIPIMIYHIPVNTGQIFHVESVAELARHENIIGVKDSTGDIAQLKRFIEVTRDENFSVYAGSDNLILKTLQLGGAGAVAATANLLPKLVVGIYESWQAGRLEEAQAFQETLTKLPELMALASFPAMLKKAVSLLGYDLGDPRLPVLPIEDQHIPKIKAYLEEMQAFVV